MAVGKIVPAVLGAVVVAGGLVAWGTNDVDYQLKIVSPSAAQLVESAPVWIDGEPVGAVEAIEAQEGKAFITVGIEDEYAPLHQGTKTRIEWKSVLGERVVTLKPGDSGNAELEDGALVSDSVAQVEVDTVLSSLDKSTRSDLSSLVKQLNMTFADREADVRRTVGSSGPAVKALSEVLEAVGRDGRAIQQLIKKVQEVTAPLATRQEEVRGVVDDLTQLSSEIAPLEQQVNDSFAELAPTLKSAKETLDLVPAASEATKPLLNDLEPATQKLVPVSRSLAPLLQNLRPTVADLAPSFKSTSRLLDETPGLLDESGKVLPQSQQAMDNYLPALSFLRPYTPELVGFATNWGNAFSGYDSQGHVWAGIPAVLGGSSANESPIGGAPSGIVTDPQPGALVDQEWTDANGDGVR